MININDFFKKNIGKYNRDMISWNPSINKRQYFEMSKSNQGHVFQISINIRNLNIIIKHPNQIKLEYLESIIESKIILGVYSELQEIIYLRYNPF